MNAVGQRLSARLLALALLSGAPRARGADTWETPFPGVRHLHRVTASQNLHVVLADLCAAGVSVRGTRPEEAGRTVAAHGAALGAQAVINGDFYNPSNPRQVDGPVMGEGVPWGGRDHSYVAPAGFGAGRVELSHHNNTAGTEPWMREVVSGHPTLLDDGARVDNSGDTTLCVPRHPRTALGITRDHRTLILAVVDGRAAGRAGMTCAELADLLAEFGAFDAMNLDGGGSSALWLGGRGVVNRPSDGRLRTPGDHLALFARGAGPAPQCPLPRCRPRCDGTVLTGPDCGRGDCAAFGSRCVDDALGARCAFAFCPDTGVRDVCWAGSRIGRCADGALTSQGDCAVYGSRCVAEGASARCVFGACPATGVLRTCLDARRIITCRDGAPTDLGDCGAFAAFCSTAVTPARCVSVFCAPDERTAPRASRSCWLEPGQVAVCDAEGALSLERCPTGQQCVVAGGARCVPAVCPPEGEATACVEGWWLGTCRGGTVVEATDCRAFGGRCLSVAGTAACETPDAGVVSDAGSGADAPVDSAPTDALEPTEVGPGDAPDGASRTPGGAPGRDPVLAPMDPSGCRCEAPGAAHAPRLGVLVLAASALGRRRRRAIAP
ncbi:MAG: phosphodiester glycosidase family protein [Deltaproteobacteria bacterium]|nr:phosphodiester glycosidase family protein [Deltaproteobacteria bacterium]